MKPQAAIKLATHAAALKYIPQTSTVISGKPPFITADAQWLAAELAKHPSYSPEILCRILQSRHQKPETRPDEETLSEMTLFAAVLTALAPFIDPIPQPKLKPLRKTPVRGFEQGFDEDTPRPGTRWT